MLHRMTHQIEPELLRQLHGLLFQIVNFEVLLLLLIMFDRILTFTKSMSDYLQHVPKLIWQEGQIQFQQQCQIFHTDEE